MFISNTRSYLLGIIWFILSLFTSAINDILSKYLGMRLNIYEVILFRFLFSMVSLIPILFYRGFFNMISIRPMMHCFRSILLFLGTICWTYGLTIEQVTAATVVTFVIPVFTLILGAIFLKEKVTWQRWFCTIIAFLGLILTLQINSNNFTYKVLVFVIAAICFSVLDIVNKKFVSEESMISMLFYSAMFTTILSLPFAIQNWVTPNEKEIFLLFLLGIGANLTLFFLLKAFAAVDITSLAPYRYIELVISSIIAYIVFSEIPTQNIIWGAIIIIPSTLFILYSEIK